MQAIAEVVTVFVQKALLLDEVDEHHAVEHQRGVPLAAALVVDAVDEGLEGAELRLEALVEALGHLLDVHGLLDAARDLRDAHAVFLFQRKGEVLKALEESITTLGSTKFLLAAGGGLAALALHPLPDLYGTVGVNENDEVLEGPLGHLSLDLAPVRVGWNRAVGTGAAGVDGELGLLGDRLQSVVVTACLDAHGSRLVVVPAQALHKKACEVKGLEVRAEFLNIDCH